MSGNVCPGAGPSGLQACFLGPEKMGRVRKGETMVSRYTRHRHTHTCACMHPDPAFCPLLPCCSVEQGSCVPRKLFLASLPVPAVFLCDFLFVWVCGASDHKGGRPEGRGHRAGGRPPWAVVTHGADLGSLTLETPLPPRLRLPALSPSFCSENKGRPSPSLLL